MSHEHRGVRAWHVLAAALAFGAAACAGILGIDDRQLDTSDGGSQQDGGTADAPSNGDAPTTGDGPASNGDGPSSTDSPSQSDTGTVDAGSCDGPCVLAMGLNHPFTIASDTKNVYWTEFGDTSGSGNGSVKGCPIAGCGSGPTTYAAALTNPRGIVTDGTSVYFGTASYGSVTGAIYACAVTGCNGSPTKLSDADVPFGLAVDATHVYWADHDDNTVHSVPKTGGGGGAVLYDGGGMAFLDEEIAADSAFLYFTDENGDLYKLPIGGGDPLLVATWGVGGGWPVKLDSTWVYYGEPGGVVAMSKNATDGGPLIVSNLQDPLGIALDPPSGRLYWADYGTGNDGTIGHVGTDGGARTLLASSQINVEDVTVSGSYVFWISNGLQSDAMGNALPSTGALFRMPK